MSYHDNYRLQVVGEGGSVPGCNWVRLNVWWVLYFTLHSHVLPRLREALPMDVFLIVTSYMRVLEYDTHG
jgi:hypothetical protein